MKNLLNKELRLAASPLSFVFLAFTAMTLLPGYPILMGPVFVCLGIFYSFQGLGESNDVLYTVLLPVRKGDAVRGKYLFAACIEAAAFVLLAALTAVRMTVLAGSETYAANALMNASPVFLGFALLIFAVFNLVFLGGFFRTAVKIGMPLLRFFIVSLLLIAAAETLHHLPGLAWLNEPAGANLAVQFALLAAAAALSAAVTLLSCAASVKRFEALDL